MRTKYSFINMMVGLGGQMVNMVLAFVSRMVFIQYLSAEYLGVNGLFTNILGMLSLAELGIGGAIVFSLYGPVAEDDRDEICRLMNLYKWLYRLIAVVVLVIGLALLPFLDYFIKGEQQIEHMQAIYLMYLANSVISYLLSYKNSILLTNQRMYVRTIYEQAFHFLQIIVQIVVLILTHNFILFLTVQILEQILVNYLVARRVDREYPYLKDQKGFPSKERCRVIWKNVWAMSLHRLGGAVVTGTDNLLMSAFVGLASVGIYSNYKLVISNANILLNKVYNAFTGSIGNLGATESRERIYEIYRALDFFNFMLYGYVAAGFLVMFNPFIRVFFGEEYLFRQSIVLVLVIDFYITGMRQINLQFRTTMGLFWYDRYKPLFEIIINLAVSIWGVLRFGVAGIFIGTIASSLLTCFWIEPYVLMRYGMVEDWKQKLCRYFAEYGCKTLSAAGAGAVSFLVCRWVPHTDILGLLAEGIVFSLVYGGIMILLYGRSREFKLLVEKGKQLRRKR